MPIETEDVLRWSEKVEGEPLRLSRDEDENAFRGENGTTTLPAERMPRDTLYLASRSPEATVLIRHQQTDVRVVR